VHVSISHELTQISIQFGNNNSHSQLTVSIPYSAERKTLELADSFALTVIIFVDFID